MSVRVGLDHRLDPDRGADQSANGSQIVDERRQVDLQPRESGQRRKPGGSQPILDGMVRG
jgi:hypothetical protein